MKASIGFRLSAIICAALLFVGMFGSVSRPTRADSGTKKAARDAEKAMGEAEQLAKECEELKAKAKQLDDDAKQAEKDQKTAEDEADKAKKDAEDEMAKIGAKPTGQDAAADKAAADADKAANDADNALDKGAEGAAGKEKTAGDKETASDAADGAAAKEDEKTGDAAVQAKKQEAREKRKERRAARRKARKARREANAALAAAKKKCKDAEDKLNEAKRLIDVLEKKLKAGAKDEESKSKLDELKKRVKVLEDAAAAAAKSEEPPNQKTVMPGAGTVTQNTTANGLNTVTFDTVSGRVTVNLPADVRAGDTISGTVIAEPKGQTKEEQSKNLGVLEGLVLEIDNKRVEPFAGKPEKEREAIIQQTFWIYHVDKPKVNPVPNAAPASHPVAISLTNREARNLAQTTIPIWSGMDQMTPSGAVITPNPNIAKPQFAFPPLGQTGKPIVITGPFDGNASTTSLNWTVARSAGQANTENVSGEIRLLAEGPRMAAFKAPGNVTGPIELHLTEANAQSTGSYRNVGVNLTAPKTTLLRGEKTTLTVEVSGLGGIKKPVPLTLTSQGVVTMEGGTYQPLVIQPSQVGADGRYSTSRGITGVQPGGWGATATVVTNRFDFTLQDDSVPARVVLLNTFSGDYIFNCPGCSLPKEGLSGKGTVSMNGCAVTLTHDATDRRVHSTIDPCTKSGSTTVETLPTGAKFTITDRNMGDNVLQAGLVQKLDEFFFGSVPSKEDLLIELEDLRERKRYDCAHGREYQKQMAERIAAIKNALRGFHGEKVLNDPIDDKC